MGSGQSSMHASHFQNENMKDELPDSDSTHHISISNKMVERLVEDAAVAGSTEKRVPTLPSTTVRREKQSDIKDRILSEKLKNLDDSHSEKVGLTVEEVKATLKRLEVRSANLPGTDPVCKDCADHIIECYLSCDDSTSAAKCAGVVNEFAKCVQDTAVTRLRLRTMKDAMEAARRTRNVNQARHHALKDLTIPPPEVPS